jgi:hypothetical protein
MKTRTVPNNDHAVGPWFLYTSNRKDGHVGHFQIIAGE